MHQITRIVESRTWMAQTQQKIHLQTACLLKRVWRLFRAGGPILHFRPAAIIFCWFVFQRNLACQFFKNFCIVLQKPEIEAEYDCKNSEFDEYNWFWNAEWIGLVKKQYCGNYAAILTYTIMITASSCFFGVLPMRASASSRSEYVEPKLCFKVNRCGIWLECKGCGRMFPTSFAYDQHRRSPAHRIESATLIVLRRTMRIESISRLCRGRTCPHLR